MTNDLDKLEQKLKNSLQDSESLDASLQSRITRARYAALEQLDTQEKFSWWAPAAMVTTAFVAVVAITLLTRVTPEQETLLDDIDMFTTADELEFYEDLEFYEWLEDHELPT